MSGKIGFISLGCPKALVDSELILTQLRAEGYDINGQYEDSDLVVINTCGFIDEAIEESLDTIGEAMAENGKVIVTGCLGADSSKILDAYPQVLAVTGPHALDEVMAAVHEHAPPVHDPYTHLIPPGGIKLTPRHYAYLKISEGCNHDCTFCIIPDLRGGLVSRAIGDVMQEAENLVKAGVRELLIVSQDTSAYGVDMKYRTGFWNGRPLKTRFQELVMALGELGIWVRLHYVYPYPHVDNVIPLMADGEILPYLDIPLQHASPRILKAMKRPANVDNMLKRIETWRDICPDISLRSTFIVGFPGETDAEFNELLDFIEAADLDRVGAFAYSPVEGAQANQLENPIDPELQQERLSQFFELQTEISAKKLATKVGRTLHVMIDGAEDDHLLGRTRYDAPEVDGIVVINTQQNINAGEIVQVKITHSDEHDLWAELL
ncbi:MAG: 30S ribosomal protein S12 methylthiotransferase RimO [Gammaproteobacteria bacterium]|nr:30S ribosomal protein S12 methylthiotransferase RimO [Gammaproteobacteria bacterium]